MFGVFDIRLTLYPLPSPVCLPNIEERNQAHGEVVEALGGPHARDGRGLGHHEDIAQIDDEHAKFQSHGRRGVARARDGLEEDHRHGTNQRGHGDDIHRRHRRLRQSHIVGVDVQDKLRHDEGHQDQNRGTQHAVFHHFPQHRHHLVALACADDATRQGVGRGRKSEARNDENHVGASDHGRYADGHLPHLLDHHEKDEPRAEREQPLDHAREGHFEDVAHQGGLPLMPTEHAVFLVRYGEIGVNPEEAEGRDFSHQRGQGRATDAHLGQTDMAENQSPVEEDVDDGHDDGREGDDLGVADADIERAEQEVKHHEDNAELPEPQILPCRRVDVFRLNDDMKQPVAEEEQNREQQDAQA